MGLISSGSPEIAVNSPQAESRKATLAPRIRLVLGPPGSGKSTLGRYIASRLGVPWISSGAVLRELAARDQRLADLLASGELVPDEVVDRVIRERLAKVGEGALLDGYPRTVAQAHNLLSFVAERSGRIGPVYYIHVPDEVAIERVLSRGRPDDSPEVIRERLRLYRLETEPVLKVFRQAGVRIAEVDNSRPLKEVEKEIDTMLRGAAPNVNPPPA
jgi:adenylate kinase